VVDQELDQGIPVLVVDADGTPLGCGRLVPRRGAATAPTRQYDPSVGEFTSVDPLEYRNEIDIDDPYVSAYVYAANRPTYFTDPSGEYVYTAASAQRSGYEDRVVRFTVQSRKRFYSMFKCFSYPGVPGGYECPIASGLIPAFNAMTANRSWT
jgi:RHS repeat-associated protein